MYVFVCKYVQDAAQLLADLEGDIKIIYFGYCFIIFINLQYTSHIFFTSF